MNWILLSGGIAIAKVPVPARSVDRFVEKRNRHRRATTLHGLSEKVGDWAVDGDEIGTDQGIEASEMLYDECDVKHASVLVLMDWIRHIRTISITKIPEPCGPGPGSEVDKVDVISHTRRTRHGVEVHQRSFSHFDELEDLGILTSACRGYSERHSVLARDSVGVGRTSHSGKISVAKVPKPSHDWIGWRGANVKKIDCQRYTSLLDIGQKRGVGLLKTNIVGNRLGGLATIGSRHCEAHGVVAGIGIDADGVVGGGDLAVAKVPLPSNNVAEGEVGKIHDQGAFASHRIGRHKCRGRRDIDCDSTDAQLCV